MNDLGVADLYPSDRQLHLSHCVLVDRLCRWYLLLALNEAKNFVRDRLVGREPLASKSFLKTCYLLAGFSGTGLDHIKLSGHFGI